MSSVKRNGRLSLKTHCRMESASMTIRMLKAVEFKCSEAGLICHWKIRTLPVIKHTASYIDMLWHQKTLNIHTLSHQKVHWLWYMVQHPYKLTEFCWKVPWLWCRCSRQQHPARSMPERTSCFDFAFQRVTSLQGRHDRVAFWPTCCLGMWEKTSLEIMPRQKVWNHTWVAPQERTLSWCNNCNSLLTNDFDDVRRFSWWSCAKVILSKVRRPLNDVRDVKCDLQGSTLRFNDVKTYSKSLLYSQRSFSSWFMIVECPLTHMTWLSSNNRLYLT